jgi:hypothetical protein
MYYIVPKYCLLRKKEGIFKVERVDSETSPRVSGENEHPCHVLRGRVSTEWYFGWKNKICLVVKRSKNGRRHCPNQVLQWLSPGRSKTGRPRARWMRGIQIAVAERGVERGQRMSLLPWTPFSWFISHKWGGGGVDWIRLAHVGTGVGLFSSRWRIFRSFGKRGVSWMAEVPFRSPQKTLLHVVRCVKMSYIQT